METPTVATSLTFRGRFDHSLDSKNRITIPSAWRRKEVDAELFVIFPDPVTRARLVVTYPEKFDTIFENGTGDATFSPAEQREFATIISSTCHDCPTDKQGRLVLPVELCRQIGLERDVTLIGSRDRFELWVPERWEEFFASRNAGYMSTYRAKGL